LTSAAFNYLTLIEKNSQQLGTLFDPQPSELPGYIHSTSNPAEPVLGYLSAVAPQEKRLFIDASQVTDCNAPPRLMKWLPVRLSMDQIKTFLFTAFPIPTICQLLLAGAY